MGSRRWAKKLSTKIADACPNVPVAPKPEFISKFLLRIVGETTSILAFLKKDMSK